MMATPHDAELTGLAGALGLRFPSSTEEWEARLRNQLEDEVYAEYLEYRMGYARELGPESAASFYHFVGSHPELTLLMQEGRLGYHSAVLPAVAEAVGRGPHGTILDLGCNCGVTSLYLARRFPASRVVGIDLCAELVERARELQEKAGAPNVEFVHGDYTQHPFAGPFDAVVSLQTMPVYFLPYIPSEQPESYRRGVNLAAVAGDPVLPSRRVRRCLAAVGRLVHEKGRVILQERLIELSRVLLFALFASQAGLRATEMRPVSWQAPLELHPGPQTSPLIVAEGQGAPVKFEEEAVINLYAPRARGARRPAPPPPESNQALVLAGPEAQDYFDSLPVYRRNVCIKAALVDGRQRHFHLGVVEGKLAYSYACDSWDARHLKVADVRLSHALLGAEAESITRGLRSGELVAIDPGPEVLPSLLRQALRS